jgi:hypothetical protein
MNRTPLVAVLSFALGATLIGGVAVATTKSAASVKACATHKGALTLLSSKGKCAKGSRAVTIAKQGPRGARGKTGSQGPGAESSVAIGVSTTSEIDGAIVVVPGTGLTIHTECQIDGHADIFITGAGNYLVTGVAQFDPTGDADAETFYYPTSGSSSTQPIATGGSSIGFQNDHPAAATNAGIVMDYNTTGAAFFNSDLLIAEGKLTFTVNVGLFVNQTNCSASAQVTPGAAP